MVCPVVRTSSVYFVVCWCTSNLYLGMKGSIHGTKFEISSLLRKQPFFYERGRGVCSLPPPLAWWVGESTVLLKLTLILTSLLGYSPSSAKIMFCRCYCSAGLEIIKYSSRGITNFPCPAMLEKSPPTTFLTEASIRCSYLRAPPHPPALRYGFPSEAHPSRFF